MASGTEWISDSDSGSGDSDEFAAGGSTVGTEDGTDSLERPDFGAIPEKRRGRPRGSRNSNGGGSSGPGYQTGQKGKKAKLDIGVVAQYLQAGHGIVARVLDNPLIEIQESEAKDLAKAIQGVLDQYEITVNPKAAAWGNLVVTCGIIYGSKWMMYESMKANGQNFTYK